MLELDINIKNDCNYINFGNIFSKSIIIKNKFDKTGSIIVIVENEKNINEYSNIFKYLDLNQDFIYNYEDFVNIQYNKNGIFFISSEIFNDNIQSNYNINNNILEVNSGEEIQISELLKKLNELGYIFNEYGNKGSFKKLGDTITITSHSGNYETIISFWGDKIDDINLYNLSPKGSRILEKKEKYYFGSNKSFYNNKGKQSILEYLSTINSFKIIDNIEFTKNYSYIIDNLSNFCLFNYIKDIKFKIIDLEISLPKINNTNELKEYLTKEKYKNIFVFTKNTKTIESFIEYNNISNINIYKNNLNLIKSFEHKKSIVISDDIISKVFIRKRIKKSLNKELDLLLKINSGDFIVHIDHGIGKFIKIIEKELGNIKKEYIQIDYKGNDKLFVPIEEVGRVNKYIGSENPNLTPLGGNLWEKKVQKASADVELIARELIDVYSKRKINKGFAFIQDKQKQLEFIAGFPYIYTTDQEKVIEEILEDMSENIPMDRILVGDVGFGKTEVAFNAIYNSYLNKKQSILIAPLVVLAYEHYEKALSRLNKFGLNIEVLTRLETPKKVTQVLKDLEKGSIDLVVGTHKLLSENIIFKNLGLLVLDEEHKFGVEHKEKIKKFKTTVDVLSMSATPIPRSLNMALSSLKSISIIKTPPYGRKPIDTIVSRYSEQVIKEAGEKEFNRGGQFFFLHNRVLNIEIIKKNLQNIFPDKKIIITHGQLPGNELENRILDFKNKKYDILLSTTVIENGIDFSNVNTIFINEAPNFGISQIHQLRGRVGRSDKKGYCYLFYKNENLKDDTKKRLKTIVDYNYLGSGFELAMKDLEIRGGGDIIGIRQSGHNIDIGINFFLKLVEDKIKQLKNKENLNNPSASFKKGSKYKNDVDINTKIDLNISISLPDEYFGSSLDKINFYREVENISSLEEIDDIKNDFKELNNKLGNNGNNFFNILKLKILASKYKITNINKIGINYNIIFDKNITEYNLKRFLTLDKELKFKVQSINKIRTPTKDFENDELFLEYILKLFEGKIRNKKIKLISKKV